jgi:raffinose/stachyose/melibiose transport system permease protein
MDRTTKAAVLNAAATPGALAGGARKPRLNWYWKGFLLVLPAVVLVSAFYLLPNVLNFALSMTNWNSYHPQITFIGFQNFIDLAQTGELWAALSVTIRYAVFVMVVENTVALTLALALEESTFLNIILRSVFFIPILISTLAAGYVFSSIFGAQGVINNFLSGIAGLLGSAPISIAWLGSKDFTLYIVGLVHAWHFGGIHMFVYIAGLKAIPYEMVEAAHVEGANGLQVLRWIKIPLLAPAFTFNITLTLIGALYIFDVVLSMTKGGPGRATEVLNLVVWRQFGTGAFGYATAFSTVLLVVILVVAIPLIFYLRRREVEL